MSETKEERRADIFWSEIGKDKEECTNDLDKIWDAEIFLTYCGKFVNYLVSSFWKKLKRNKKRVAKQRV